MDDKDDEIAVVGVAKAPPPQPINLCDDDDDDDYLGTDYTQSMMQSLRNKKRKASRGLSSSSLSSNAAAAKKHTGDAIDLLDDETSAATGKDNNSTNPADANETKYRQALGPVRMDFVNSWKSTTSSSSQGGQVHTFHNAKPAAPASRVGSRNLYQELLEYQLNLPVNWSSSIFCRVQESRTDLLRVLITGAFVCL